MEGAAGQVFCLCCQFYKRDDIGQGRVFYQVDNFIAAAGQGLAKSLGNNNRAQGLHGLHQKFGSHC